MFHRLARTMIAHRRWVIAAWLLAAVAIIPFSPKLGDVTNSDEASFLPRSYESSRADRLARQYFPGESGASAVIVFRRKDGKRLAPADQRRAGQASHAVGRAGIDRVAGVQTGAPGQLSPDSKMQLARVAFNGGSGDEAVMGAAGSVRDDIRAQLKGSDLEATVTGDAAIRLDDQDAHKTAEKTVGVATIALILILLTVMFRSPVAALLPILSIAVVFLLANSLISLAARGIGFDVSLDLPPLLTVVLFGIGTDYILFTLFRFRENLRDPARADDALAAAAGRVGEVITFAALVVIVAFSALGLSQLGSLRTMAPGLVIGVALMWLAGVTLIPAVLSLLGPRVFWPSRHRPEQDGVSGYGKVGELIARHPARMALASGGLLAALATGVLFYSADYDSIKQLPAGSEARQAYEDMQSAFPPGVIAPTRIYVAGKQPIDQRRLARLMAGEQRPAAVASVNPPVYSADRKAARIDVILRENPYSNQALDAIEGPIREAARSSGAGERVLVGGQTASSADIRTATRRDYTVVFPVAALVIALLLAWLLRSLVAPVYLLASVILGFAATLGLTVGIFQGMLGQAGLKSMLPILVYLFVVAVGTDYSILMTARIREETVAGIPPRRAVALGVRHGGPAIAAAGIILAGTFTSLLLTGIASLTQIGLAVSGGILIASLVMATILVPSLTALFGGAAWWPGQRRRG